MSTALFIDTKTRKLNTSTVSVTQTETGLVLRFAADLGPLSKLTGEFQDGSFRSGLPIIVPNEAYQACKSAGFVQPAFNHRERWYDIVGIQGFPWMHYKGLQRCSPMQAVVLRPGTEITPVRTHADLYHKGGKGSNPDAAKAAMDGFWLMVGARKKSVFLAEGQSDYTKIWELVGSSPHLYKKSWLPDFEKEHRADIFSLHAMIQFLAGKENNENLCRLFRAVELYPHSPWGIDLVELNFKRWVMWVHLYNDDVRASVLTILTRRLGEEGAQAFLDEQKEKEVEE